MFAMKCNEIKLQQSQEGEQMNLTPCTDRDMTVSERIRT